MGKKQIRCRCQHCGESLTLPKTATWKLGDIRYTSCLYCHQETEVDESASPEKHSSPSSPLSCEYCRKKISPRTAIAVENEDCRLIAVCRDCLWEAETDGYRASVGQADSIDLLVLASEEIPFYDPPLLPERLWPWREELI